MPAIPTNAPTAEHEFLGVKVSVPYTFADGAVLTANEAAFLNRQVASVVGNQLGGDVRRAVAALNDERTAAFKAKTYTGPMDESGKKPAVATLADLNCDLQDRFLTKFSEYQLGVANRSGDGPAPRDPIAARALEIAKEQVKAKIIAKGGKVNDFMKAKVTVDGEEISAFLNQARIRATNPEVVALATAQVEAAKALVDTSDDIDLTLPEAAPAE